MTTPTLKALLSALDGALHVTPGGKVKVKDEAKLRARAGVLAQKSARASALRRASLLDD